MSFFLGVDGGGSHTRAVLGDQSGRILAYGLSGPSNIQELPDEDIMRHLDDAISQVLAKTNGVSIEGAFLGIAGVVSPTDREQTIALARQLQSLKDARIDVDHDISSALAGGLAGQPGIALVAGTGSSCYGRDNNNKTYQCGGWGSIADDIGSGSWIGLRALQEAVRQADGRSPETRLLQTVFDFLRINSIEYFMGHIHRKKFSRTERAKLAPIIIQLYETRDPSAVGIIEQAIDGLVELVGVTTCRLQLQPVHIVLTGGLTENPTFSTLLKQAINERVPASDICQPKLSPLLGCLLIAAKCNGITITESFINQIETSA